MLEIIMKNRLSAAIWLAFAIGSTAAGQHLPWVGSYDSLSSPADVLVQGDYAYVIDAALGIVILDISDGDRPEFLGSCNPSLAEMALAVRSGIAFMGNGYSEPYSGRFFIADVSNPWNPSVIGNLQFPWEVTNVEVAGDYAYITEYGGNHIINISDLYNPFIAGTFQAPSFLTDMHFDSLLYIADVGAGLAIMSLADPLNPQLVGICDTPGNAVKVALGDSIRGYAYVADRDSGLAIIDIHDPQNPVLVRSVPLWGRTQDVAVSGRYAHAVTDDALYVIDISVPEVADIVVSTDISGNVTGIDHRGGYDYVTTRTRAMQIYYLTTPGRCDYIPGDLNGTGTANGIDVVYGVGYFSGLHIPPIACDCPPIPYPFYAAGDVNGNCVFNGIDITYFVRYLKGQVPSLLHCPTCPPISRRGQHDDIRGDCVGAIGLDNPGYMQLEVVGDDLHVYHMDAEYQCCLDYYVEYQMGDFSILAVEHDRGPLCDCKCLFNLESILYDLLPGDYVIALINIAGDTIGYDYFHIPGN